MDITIVSARDKPAESQQLRELFAQQWEQDFDLFKGSTTALPVPYPLLALHKGKVLGGLAYCNFAAPKSNCLGLWINAVLVLPEYRGRGIASRLIQAAEQEVQGSAVSELFAFTEVPQLYCKLNWTTVSSDRNDYVVAKTIEHPVRPTTT